MGVHRWTRRGQDRLYLTADDGTDLGWWDLRTDEAHPASPDAAIFLEQQVQLWRSQRKEQPSTDPPETRGPDFAAPVDATLVRPSRTDSPQPSSDDPAVVDWAPPSGPAAVRDFIHNPPGASLYEQVAQARAAGQRPTFLRRLFLGKNAYSSWELGLIGEQLVERELRKLVENDRRWGYFNSIPIGENGADIDHVLAGPAGVFTINSKYHRGANIWVGGDTLMVNGSRHPYVRNSRFEARRAAALLTRACGFEVSVHGLVVPVDARNFTVRSQPAGVTVINRSALVHHLRRLPEALSAADIYTVLSMARLGTTWQK